MNIFQSKWFIASARNKVYHHKLTPIFKLYNLENMPTTYFYDGEPYNIQREQEIKFELDLHLSNWLSQQMHNSLCLGTHNTLYFFYWLTTEKSQRYIPYK